MRIKYDIEISKEDISKNLRRLINQTYKLLPNREESVDWIKPLKNIIEELSGMSNLLENLNAGSDFFSLLCKLEGLKSLTSEDSFDIFRGTIFECLGLLNKIKELLECQD